MNELNLEVGTKRANVNGIIERCYCRGLSRYIRVQLTMRYYARNNMTVPRIFEAMVKKHPDRTCFIFEDTKWTFREVHLPSILCISGIL